MPIFLSDDESLAFEHAITAFEGSMPLHDSRANDAFQAGVRWLARRLFITQTYRMVFALVRELAVRDRCAHVVKRDPVLNEPPPTIEDIEALFATLKGQPTHITTMSRLAQAAFHYYTDHGKLSAVLRLPHAITPPDINVCIHGVQRDMACPQCQQIDTTVRCPKAVDPTQPCLCDSAEAHNSGMAAGRNPRVPRERLPQQPERADVQRVVE